MKSRARLAIGLAFWIVAAASAWRAHGRLDPQGERTARLVGHWRGKPQVFAASFPAAAKLTIGGMVKIETDDGLLDVGRVVTISEIAGGQRADVEIWPEFVDRLGPDCRLRAHSTSGKVSWIVETLLPPERLREIEAIAREGWAAERERLMRALRPGIERLAADAITALREELPGVLDAHRDAIRRIGVVFREKAWDAELQPIFHTDVWPLVEERSLPILADIGDAIIKEVPVWALSWSYVVQSLPFTDDDRVGERVRAFIREKAMPVVRSYDDEFRAMAASVVRDSLADERVVAAMQRAAESVVDDARFRESATEILRAWLLDNERLRRLLLDAAERPDLRQPIEQFISALDPSVKRIANLVLMNDDRTGINPDLARVLRRRLMREDENWILLVPDPIGGRTPSLPLEGEDGGIR